MYEGDLDQPLPAELRGRVDLLLANVPYVPTDEVALLPAGGPAARAAGGARRRRGRAGRAAPGGRRGARRWLAPGGHLLVETSERQAARAVEIVGRAGLAARVASSEELEATVVVGTRPEHRAG